MNRRDEVADGVVRITAPLPIPEPDSINCYLLRLADGDVLVDSGMRGAEAAIDAGLAAAGAAVESIVLTHGHPDHWGLAPRYADRVLAHPDAHAQLLFAESDAEQRAERAGWSLSDEMFALLTAWRPLVMDPPRLQDLGDHVGEWQVIDTPGHAPGHICLYRERDGVLIAGDHLLPVVTPNIHLSPEAPDAVKDYLDSLALVRGMDISLVLPAHGEPFTDAAGRADELIAHHRRRLDKLETLLSGGPSDTADLTTALFTRSLADPADRLMAELETHAHLEHLRRNGRVGHAAPDRWWSQAA